MSPQAAVQTQPVTKPTITPVTHGLLQRAAVNSSPVGEVPPIVHEVLRSSGQSLDARTRAFMEPRFGHDFSSVRVHTNEKAAQSAKAVNALAYTVGRDVVFGTGQYVPETNDGRTLIAHELTHVIQQGNSLNITNGHQIFIDKDQTIYETEADQAAAKITKYLPNRLINKSLSIGQLQSNLVRLQRRTIHENYATAAFETGPFWDVSLIITGVPEHHSESVQDFINACMDGIRSAARSLGRGSGVRSRNFRVRIRYRGGQEYSTVSQRAFTLARQSVVGRETTERERSAETEQTRSRQPTQNPSTGNLTVEEAATPAGQWAQTAVGFFRTSAGSRAFVSFLTAPNEIRFLRFEARGDDPGVAGRNAPTGRIARTIAQYLDLSRGRNQHVVEFEFNYRNGIWNLTRFQQLAEIRPTPQQSPTSQTLRDMPDEGERIIADIRGTRQMILSTAAALIEEQDPRRLENIILAVGPFALGRISKVARLARLGRLSRIFGRVGRSVFGEVRFSGLIRNRVLRELTHEEIYQAFRNTPFTPSNHAIMRLKDVRTTRLGIESLNDVERLLNRGVIQGAGEGLIQIEHSGMKMVVNPQTNILVTLSPL